jgi:tetratricopeptide (TPR) repeat protein
MLGGDNSTLLEVEDLLKHMKIDEATTKLDNFEKQDKITEEESLRAKMLRVELLFRIGRMGEGLEIMEQILPVCEKSENNLIGLDILHLRSKYHNQFGNFDRGIKDADQGLNIIKELNSSNKNLNQRESWFLYFKGLNHYQKGNVSFAQEIKEDCIKISTKIDDPYHIYACYYLEYLINDSHSHHQANYETSLKMYDLAREMKNDYLIADSCIFVTEISQFIGKYDEAMKYANESLDITRNQKWLSTTKEAMEFHLATTYFGLGELKEAVSIWKRILPELKSKVMNPIYRGKILMADALVNWFEGDLEEAVKIQKQVIEIVSKTGNQNIIEHHRTWLSRYLLTLGQYNQAERICQENIEKHNDLTFNINKAIDYFIIGKIYQIRGEFFLASDHLKQSLKIRKSLGGFGFMIIHCLFHIILLLSERNQEEECYRYLGELEKTINEYPSKLHNKYFHTAKAIILKASSRPKNWIQAIRILEEVVEDIFEGKFGEPDLLVIALINLCELLMNEYSISGEEEVINDLEKYISKLQETTKELKMLSHHIRLEIKSLQLLTIWLKTIYSLADADLQKVKTLIEEARDLADEEGLVQLSEKINLQHSRLYKQLLQWNEFIQKQDII